MRIAAAPPRDVVADAMARLVVDHAWSGTLPQLHAAIDAVSTAAERLDDAWPRSAADLARGLRSHTDALREHGLRMSVMPLDVLLERIRHTTAEPPAAGGSASKAAVRAAARPRSTTLSDAA